MGLLVEALVLYEGRDLPGSLNSSRISEKTEVVFIKWKNLNSDTCGHHNIVLPVFKLLPFPMLFLKVFNL